MQVLLFFARRYPSRSIIMLVCLSLAAVAEGVGLSSLLPMLSMLDPGGEQSSLEKTIRAALEQVGLAPTLEVLLGLIVTGTTLKALLTLVAQREIGYTVANVATDLRLALLRALLSARWLYYVRQPVGMLANSFATEASRASEAYLYGTTLVSQLIQTTLYVAIAASVSLPTTLAACVVGGLTVFSLSGLVRMTKRAGRKQTDLLRTVLGRMTDVLYAVKPLKAMGRESLVAPLLEGQTQKLNRALQRQVLSKEGLRAVQEPLLVITLAGGLYAAVGYLGIPIKSVAMLALVFARALFSLQKAQKQFQAMVACESAFWSIRRIIQESEDAAELNQGTRVPDLVRELRFDAVDFMYEERPILAKASLIIPAGKVTAIVGPSGAGKTTIADLALGLVRPQGGEILLDDVPLAEINIAAWRHKVGYVPQEMLLLHDSVRVNVTLGDPALSEQDVREALEAAGAWDFVGELPQGMETPVGERGARLSGGQRQRIAIARALVQRPILLILDEATAALDPTSERGIYDTVRSLRGRTTVLAISHQPGLLEVADHVYRLTDGRVDEIPSGADPHAPEGPSPKSAPAAAESRAAAGAR